MNMQLGRVRRRFDGSIDFDFYRRRAMALRRGRICYYFRRVIAYRLAFYAAAICIGVAIGEHMPLPAADCLNCQQTGVDIDDARRNAIELDGYVTVAGPMSHGRPPHHID